MAIAGSASAIQVLPDTGGLLYKSWPLTIIVCQCNTPWIGHAISAPLT